VLQQASGRRSQDFSTRSVTRPTELATIIATSFQDQGKTSKIKQDHNQTRLEIRTLPTTRAPRQKPRHSVCPWGPKQTGWTSQDPSTAFTTPPWMPGPISTPPPQRRGLHLPAEPLLLTEEIVCHRAQVLCPDRFHRGVIISYQGA